MFLRLCLMLFYGCVVGHAMRCPDDSYVRKEFDGIPRCYKLYKAADTVDRCKFIDYCRPLHPKAIPATINSEDELDFLKTLVSNTKEFTLLGAHIPCPKEYSNDSFVNIDGSQLPVPVEKTNGAKNDEFLVMLVHGKTDDVSPNSYYFNHYVICAITQLDYVPEPPPSFIDVKASRYGCPDNSYIYAEFIGIRKCYKVFEFPSMPDKCNPSTACLELDENARPLSFDSILEREFIKQFPFDATYVLLGDYIPCDKPFDLENFVRADGKPLEVQIEAGNINDQNSRHHFIWRSPETEHVYSQNDVLTDDKEHVMCAITLPHCPFPFRRPKDVDIITNDTTCEFEGPPEMFYLSPVFPKKMNE